MIKYPDILHNIQLEINKVSDRGNVASYIPELSKIDPHKFGMHIIDANQNEFSVGDSEEAFSIQSISKVLSLSQAIGLIGEELWSRVDVEPSGDPFNHLSLLEQENGIPRNPLINAGAIVVADILVSKLKNPKEDFLTYIQEISGDKSINFDADVATSEKETGFRNYAAANLLKSYGNLHNDVDTVLDFYFHQCSLALNCKQLTKLFFVFMNRGKCLQNKTYLTTSTLR